MSFVNLIVVILLVILSGLFSGLNLGLMGLSPYELKRKAAMGDKRARKLYPLRKNGNLLLCTILLGNVLVNSVLAIFLGSLTTGVVAVIVSTALIVIFGEIVPQAVISRYAIAFGSKTTWIVYVFMVVLYPLTKPIAYTLDRMLGRELPTTYSKKEIALVLEEQQRLHTSDVDPEDVELAVQGLEFADKLVKDVMTPKKNTEFVKADRPLTIKFLQRLERTGHSRFPVYQDTKDRVVGILYMKDLVTIHISGKRKARNVMRKKVQYVYKTDKLGKVLNLFKKKRTHLFIVRDSSDKVVGIITLEDALEEITGEIVDEFDRFVDMRTMKS